MRLFKHSCPEYKIKILDYTYTSEPSINNALPLNFNKTKFILFVIGCVISFGFLWLLASWSAKKKAILIYDVCEVQQATHFLIEEEDIVGGCTIVSRFNKFDVKRKEKAVGFCYHERTYLYHPEKQVFLPIRYEDLGLQLDKLKKGIYEPYKPKSRKKLLDHYGHNEICLPVQSVFQVFIQEMLTPYEVFQLYAIVLWIYEQYYIFSFILLAYSLYTYWTSSMEVVRNQQKLADQSFFDFKCKIFTKDSTTFMAVSGENSDDMSIIEEVKTARREEELFHDPNFLHLQEQIDHYTAKTSQQSQSDQGYTRRSSIATDVLETVGISSRELLPGDLLILKQGDIVPCDCIIISGEALLNEKYISGDSFLVRKSELQGFLYSKDRQNSFVLYLGTQIAKVKQISSFKQDQSQVQAGMSDTGEQFFKNILGPKEIACVVTQTNYNTQRGKYIRAVRYQKKPTENFTKQTIYFLYIILAFTTLVFLILMPVISEGISRLSLFVIYLDLLATSIPMTLPTALSVGISFAQHRLSQQGIHSILPSNILAGGRATTIVLDSNKIFGKNYQIQSIVVGIKANRRIGTTYESLDNFLGIDHSLSQSYFDDPLKKKIENDKISQNGKMILRAFAACHTMEYYNDDFSGIPEQKQMYSFAKAKYLHQDLHSCLDETIRIKDRIFFKEKDKKLAVVCQVEKTCHNKTGDIKSRQSLKQQEEVIDSLDEKSKMEQIFPVELPPELAQKTSSKKNLEKPYIIMKGPVQKIVPLCLEDTCPNDAFQYVVDMAEKGFKLVCFCYKVLDEDFNRQKDAKKMKDGFIFCGFAILEMEKNEATENAIKQLKKSRMKMMLISEDLELEASSMAIHNKFVTKNELLVCSMRKGKVICRGHVEWQSSQDTHQVEQFLQESAELIQRSKVSLTSKLYEQLFMKREDDKSDRIFNQTIIFNEMQNRHSKNLYMQIEKKNEVSFAVGSGSSVSECAHLSLELQRGQCSVLSSFHTQSKNLSCITQCLIICRAALATNFHCFSMMVLFSLVQFTTVSLLYREYQIISDDQMLYEDLFVTFPIFITINLTKPVSRLSGQLPPSSFFSLRSLSSMIGQLLIQFVAQLGFILYLFSIPSFQKEREASHAYYLKTGDFAETAVSLATFILTNYLYLGIVLSTSVSKPFRKPFYTNPYYTLTLIVLWMYNTAIVLVPALAPITVRKKDLSKEVEYMLIIAMLLGNMVMMLMYFYENLLVWIWEINKKIGRRGQQPNQH